MKATKNEIKYLRSLRQKKVRDHERKFVLEGWRALEEALVSDFEIEYVGVSTHVVEHNQYTQMLEKIAVDNILIKRFRELEMRQVTDTVHSQGVFALLRQKAFTLETILTKDNALIMIFDTISDPGNLGTMIRSCDWFGVDGIILGKGCVDLYSEKVIRSTAGSIFHIPIIQNADLPVLLSKLKKEGFQIIALSADGQEQIDELKFAQKSCLVVGSEAHGLQETVKEKVDTIAKVPKFGKAESLNAGVACGIALSWVKMGSGVTKHIDAQS